MKPKQKYKKYKKYKKLYKNPETFDDGKSFKPETRSGVMVAHSPHKSKVSKFKSSLRDNLVQQRKKEDKTLSNLTSGDTKLSPDISTNINERSGTEIMDNHSAENKALNNVQSPKETANPIHLPISVDGGLATSELEQQQKIKQQFYEIISSVLSRYKNENEDYCLGKAEGQKQERERVMKIIDEWIITFKTNCDCRMCFRFKEEFKELKSKLGEGK